MSPEPEPDVPVSKLLGSVIETTAESSETRPGSRPETGSPAPSADTEAPADGAPLTSGGEASSTQITDLSPMLAARGDGTLLSTWGPPVAIGAALVAAVVVLRK